MTLVDDAQASEYRRKMKARTRYKIAQERALAGSSAARQELQANWQPLIDWYSNERESDGEVTDIPEDGQIFNLNPGLKV